MDSDKIYLQSHHHGKNRVRVLKVTRNPGRHEVFEFDVRVTVDSNADASFTSPDNSKVVATDSIKNTVYVVAKQNEFDSPEQFGIQLVEFFLEKYPAIIYQVRVEIKQTIWRRAQVSSGAHEHGFYRHGPEYNVVDILGNKQGYRRIISGVRDLIVLKTTQTGFENFYRNEHTTLPDAKDRLLGTNISASWLLGDKNLNFNEIRRKISEAMTETFFGNAQRGVYSYSVQQTLHDMGVASLRSCPDVKEIKLSLPNIHFLPYHHLGNLGSKFENDIYLPTDEPHGLIQATVARGEVSPSILARL